MMRSGMDLFEIEFYVKDFKMEIGVKRFARKDVSSNKRK